jgi:hypothetical protein
MNIQPPSVRTGGVPVPTLIAPHSPSGRITRVRQSFIPACVPISSAHSIQQERLDDARFGRTLKATASTKPIPQATNAERLLVHFIAANLAVLARHDRLQQDDRQAFRHIAVGRHHLSPPFQVEIAAGEQHAVLVPMWLNSRRFGKKMFEISRDLLGVAG